jgi:hypothetical protein
MPITIKEQALAGFDAQLRVMTGVNFFGRNFYDTLAEAELPAIIMFDGADEVLESPAGVLFISQGVAVEARFNATSPEQCGPRASEWYGNIRAALGANPTLGGLVYKIEFAGADEPAFRAEPGPSYGRMVVGFVVVRQEAELDPYSTQ